MRWGKLFIETNLEQRYEASDYARRFLENRLEQMRGKLEDSERKAVAYAASHGIILLPSASNVAGKDAPCFQRRSLACQRRSRRAQQCAFHRDRRADDGAKAVLRAAPDASSGALENDAIARMREQRAEAKSEYDKVLQQFEPNYPPAEALQAQIQSLDKAIADRGGHASARRSRRIIGRRRSASAC